MLTVLRRLWGHVPTGPSGVFDQSKARMRAPISPPPWRNVRFDGSTAELFITRQSARSVPQQADGLRATRLETDAIEPRVGSVDAA
jgi:hypothetical protein